DHHRIRTDLANPWFRFGRCSPNPSGIQSEGRDSSEGYERKTRNANISLCIINHAAHLLRARIADRRPDIKTPKRYWWRYFPLLTNNSGTPGK
ncbi:MAG: hypothetical protein ACREMY_30045, partial [bacterium]